MIVEQTVNISQVVTTVASQDESKTVKSWREEQS